MTLHKTRPLLDQLNTVIASKKQQVQDCVACLLTVGHLLIEDVPGVRKTTVAHAMAESFGLQFSGAEITTDLMACVLAGASVYVRSSKAFVFHRGPMLTQALLADEINRASD